MSFFEHQIELKINYSARDCFKATIDAVSRTKYEIQHQDENTGTVNIAAKGISVSPGDFVTVTIFSESANLTKVVITGGVKLPYLLAKRNSIKYAEAFASAFKEEISKYKEIENVANFSIDSGEEKLIKLKSLYERDLITEDEYQSKREEILKSFI